MRGNLTFSLIKRRPVAQLRAGFGKRRRIPDILTDYPVHWRFWNTPRNATSDTSFHLYYKQTLLSRACLLWLANLNSFDQMLEGIVITSVNYQAALLGLACFF